MGEWENADYMNEKRGGKPTVYSLKELNSILSKISFGMTKLEMVLVKIIAKRALREKILMEDDKEVLDLIGKLQKHVTQIENVTLLFDEKASHALLQAELNRTLNSLTNIKDCLVSLYNLKNENDLQQYNPAIKNCAKTAQLRVKSVLDEVENCVKIYNKENRRQLNFKIKWVTLKEDAE